MHLLRAGSRHWLRAALPVAVAVLTGLAPREGHAQGAATPPPAQTAPAAPSVRLTLEESLRAALQRSPETRQALAEVEGYRGKQLQALGIGRPQIELSTALGPSPRARGDQVSSPDDQYSTDITGVFVRGGVSIIQPIFTWGLVENARLAAEHGVRAAQAGVDVKSTEVALRVKQAYWGIVAAKSIRAFLLEVRQQVEDAIARTERLVEGGYATDIDVFRFRAKLGELDRGLHQTEKTIDLATQALGAWTGQPPGVAIEPADAALPEDIRPLPSVDTYVRDAIAIRPEFAQLREGIQARRRLVEVERKQAYPLFFVGLLGDLAYATNRDRLENPYVIDPLYHAAVGPVVGFKYSLDFGIRAGKVKEAEAEVQKLEALQLFATDNIPLQVRDAHTTIVEAARNVKVLAEAHDNAKRWLVASSSNVDLGLGDPDDLADAFAQYARSRAEYFQALYAYVFGLEQLAHAAGQDVAEVQRLVPPKP
ncbi:MAG TPA: TolC family protein [Methylomirabilota bacterium]|nr:TolC family protein [Methylomirabilota bacterium]